MDYHTSLTALHLLGVVIGMGGAFSSDLAFFSSIRDEKISKTEMRFLKLGGKMVWIGLFVIVISGALLFTENPEHYLNSSKFLAKITIVAIIIANGVIFHAVHIPRLHRHAGQHFPSSDEFMRKAPFLITSGVISIVSWLSAFFLGILGRSPHDYLEILSVYLAVLLPAAAIAVLLKKKLIPHLR